jgi:gliding motility-associated-like protein
VIEKDNIKELFSRTLENHTTPVRPEVWNGLQAKMAAAGVSSVGAGAAAKGLSALTKWLIGSAAVAGTAVVTTIAVVNTSETPKKANPVKTETAPVALQHTPEQVAGPADGTPTATSDQDREQQERTIQLLPSISDGGLFEDVHLPMTIGKEDAKEKTIAPAGNPITVTDPVYAGQTIPEKPVVVHTTEREDEPVAHTETPADRNDKAPKIEYPNIFTPNGDGENDKYKLITHDNIKSIDIVITDTQNKVVYRSNDQDFEWDGTHFGNGEPVPDGLYACSVVYKDMNDNIVKDILLVNVKRK